MFWFCLRSVHLHLQQILSQKLSTHQSVSFCLVSLFLFVIYNPFLAIYFLSSFLSGFINSSLFIVTLHTHPCAHTHTRPVFLSRSVQQRFVRSIPSEHISRCIRSFRGAWLQHAPPPVPVRSAPGGSNQLPGFRTLPARRWWFAFHEMAGTPSLARFDSVVRSSGCRRSASR